MSHDQKPPRVRVVQNAGTPSRRRRRDGGSPAVAVIDGNPPVDATTTGGAADIADARAGMTLALGALFLLAAGGGGILVALLTRS
ncbi:hypothetical protein ACT009_09820 [Sphingomonas sp. Tas61C01]|uniref:hypothetical protein n=1 Tax=Sphingomonas sp. Tas61C01 TaxID=3458297 RepID=UPI00403E6A57